VDFVSAVATVVVVFVRFFGLGSSTRASAFSLSSAPKYSLMFVSFIATLKTDVKAGHTLFSSDSSLSRLAQQHFDGCP
jgi:hypothetical protein